MYLQSIMAMCAKHVVPVLCVVWYVVHSMCTLCVCVCVCVCVLVVVVVHSLNVLCDQRKFWLQ